MVVKKFLHTVMMFYRKLLKFIFLNLFNLINFLPKGRFATTDGLDAIFKKKTKIQLDLRPLEFHAPNWITHYRATSILQKEPETLKWIESMVEGSVLWDVGANIGTFSIIAARRNLRVVSIEPSFMNIELLNRNVISNGVADTVTILPFGLGSKTSVVDLFMSSQYLTWGGAHNSLGANIGAGGKSMENPVRTQAPCFTIDKLLEIFHLPPPTHLKIDVDGLEVEVLKGALNALKNISSILIEVDSEFFGHVEGVKEILEGCSFINVMSGSDTKGSYNQIWQKITTAN